MSEMKQRTGSERRRKVELERNRAEAALADITRGTSATADELRERAKRGAGLGSAPSGGTRSGADCSAKEGEAVSEIEQANGIEIPAEVLEAAAKANCPDEATWEAQREAREDDARVIIEAALDAWGATVERVMTVAPDEGDPAEIAVGRALAILEEARIDVSALAQAERVVPLDEMHVRARLVTPWREVP